MFYCKVNEFHLRKESYSFDDGTAIDSERIFIYNTVKDLERFNDGDDGVQSTVIIVKGIDTDYLKMISPNTGAVGGVYKTRRLDHVNFVFEIFTTDDEFDRILELLETTRNDKICNLIIYVNLHQYYDFNEEDFLPITSLSVSLDDDDSRRILTGFNS